MLNSSIPSIFISAVRLSSLLTGHSETLNNFLSNNWKKLFDVNQKFPNNDVIQYNVSILIFNIFKSHKLSNSQNFILANHNLILNQTQRGFFYFAKIYPLLFNIATQKSVVFETKFLPPLNRFLPFPYIESFFGMINEVATYQHQIHKDPNIIKEICKEFLKLTQCINVVYLHEYVYRFELFLSNFYENEEIVKKLILIRPFFHLFVGTIRFVMVQEEKNSQINNQMNEKKINEKNFENNNEQSHENDNEENEEKSDERSTETKKENIRKSLTFLMKLKCRAHSMAFGIALNDPKNMKKALELAAFDSDCSESEKILATYSYKTV
ncbi:hypothetical protein TRFO_08322 [Tritrichomonas foetus]|uniref:Uncharacterized protein n=1 Tax=Tritrichomonas foetus TaxID=1144522 RepID=A0A1J4JLW4_9EUKA|nr:hypothetical protein TRFO_08322 [Tritrichomonas foetus]|eukprot:OHS99681.1 hypothetical protein TRFO_08322 [Tritrichomonas foetus]